LARYRADGEIEYLGRIDHQVKIRGFRIELGEIETKLRQHPAVAEAALVPLDDPATGKRLIAYLVLRKSSSAHAGELRSFLKRSLPDYMIPAVFMCLESFPLTANGKIDRKALPLPAISEGETTGTPPRTPTEERIAEIWRDVLKVASVSIHDDFFALGGHSILAIQVTARVRDMFECDLPVAQLFESPTIAQLAAALEAKLLEEITQLSDAEAERLSETVLRNTP
jgi:acyl carrier protein